VSSAPDKTALTTLVRNCASELGFDNVGICPAVPATGFARLRDWLERGYSGKMQYISDRLAAYEHPRYVLAGARSLVVLAMNYRTEDPAAVSEGQGRVSRYAWGVADYHDVIQQRLKQLVRRVNEAAPGSAARGVVDTAPLLERDFARLAGLGWIGKHTLLLNRHAGSWFFLAVLLTDQELDYTDSQPTDHCGTCTACLDACPTDAFPEPYVLDATRCISYLTIELREAVPTELREPMGDWLFGCDVCQDVCPWNRHAPLSNETEFASTTNMNPVSLSELFDLDDASFRRRFRQTPLWRTKRSGLLRNAAIVLGNQQASKAIPALTKGLHDDEPTVRGASAWALGQMNDELAKVELARRRAVETDPEVTREIDAYVQ